MGLRVGVGTGSGSSVGFGELDERLVLGLVLDVFL